LNRVYASFDILIDEELKLPAEERMEVISVLTPNFLHFPMAKKLLENGFNVIYLGSNLPHESLNQVNEKIKIDNTLMFSVSNSSLININSTIEYLESNFQSANNYIVSKEITTKMIPEKSTINILSDVNSFINIISK
jgi:hypothetical protein